MARPSQKSYAVELTLFLWHTPADIAELWSNTAQGCNHQSTCMPSYSLYVQLLWYPMYYPGGMKAQVSPVQWSKPHSILAPLRIGTRATGFKIIKGDYYFTTAHCTQNNLRVLLSGAFKFGQIMKTPRTEERIVRLAGAKVNLPT